MTNNNTAISLYEATITVNGERSTVNVGAPHITEWEKLGIGTRVFIRELLRKETGASRVSVGTRVGTCSASTAKKGGVKVFPLTDANIAKAIKLRDARKDRAEQIKLARTVLSTPQTMVQVKEAEVTETAKIRAWAKANGIAVADRGRIALTVITAYNKAMKKQAKKARKANKATTVEAPAKVEASVNIAALKALPKEERMALLMMLLED